MSVELEEADLPLTEAEEAPLAPEKKGLARKAKGGGGASLSPSKKRKNNRKKNQPGKYSQLVVETIRKLGERGGSSLAKVYKEAKKVGWFDQQNGRTYLKYSIKALVQNDTLLQVKGTGANGSFKLNKKKLEGGSGGVERTTPAVPAAPSRASRSHPKSHKKAVPAAPAASRKAEKKPVVSKGKKQPEKKSHKKGAGAAAAAAAVAAAELQGKYQKLAQEYSKLRAQNQVLKKGVVDEQANSASLKEQLKMKDQSLRKLQQEMDSLTFRNQQLAKRVELLQDELTLSESKGKKNKRSGETTSQLSQEQKNVFDEDLQKKIEENERLHIQFFEADEQHKRLESELRGRLEVLEMETAQHQAVVDGLTRKYMDTIEKLQSEKAKLEIKSQTLEREAKDCRVRTEECQQQLKNLHSDLSSRLDESLHIISEKVPFNDTRSGQYNSLNVPLHNRRRQLKLRDLAGQALAFIQDLVTALLNFHTYMEQRVQIFPVDSATDTISPLNQKFSHYLHENASYVRPLEEGMLHLFESITEDTVTVLETTVKLKSFSDYLGSYVCFLRKILPYQLKSLEEECESSLCTAALRARNMELQNDMKKLVAVFEKLHTYINLLALPSIKPVKLLRTNFNSVFTHVASGLHGFHDVMKDISKHYSHKAALEQDLPTATQKLITTNDCILSSVVALTNAAGKVASFFSNNLDCFTASLSCGPKGGMEFIHPLSAECMLQYKKKAAAYMKLLKKPCSDSVPYEEALANRRVLLSSTESREGLAQQVQQSLEKIAKLEQEKEHWMLEAQLAKIRLEKDNKKVANKLKNSSSPMIENSQESSIMLNAMEQEDSGTEKVLRESVKSSSLVGLLTMTTGNEEIPEADTREDLIKNHYMARIVELTSQLQLADSKSVHFHAECRALAKRLSLAEKSKESSLEEIRVARQSITKLQDELTTTKRSYEDQLSMMSDHLCSMNETLSKQQEEIEMLKLSSKGNSKKNKSR